MIRAGCGLLVLALLAGCGRMGPPQRPGPADQVTYPKLYPNPRYESQGGLPGIWTPEREAAPPAPQDAPQDAPLQPRY